MTVKTKELGNGEKVKGDFNEDPTNLLDMLNGNPPKEEEKSEELEDELEETEVEDDGEDGEVGESEEEEAGDGEEGEEEDEEESGDSEVEEPIDDKEAQLAAALETINDLSKGLDAPLVNMPGEQSQVELSSRQLMELSIPTQEEFDDITSDPKKFTSYLNQFAGVVEQNTRIQVAQDREEQTSTRRAEDQFLSQRKNRDLAPVAELVRLGRKSAQATNPKLSAQEAIEASATSVRKKLKLSVAAQEAGDGPIKLKRSKKGLKKGRHAQRGGKSSIAQKVKSTEKAPEPTEEDKLNDHINQMAGAGRS